MDRTTLQFLKGLKAHNDKAWIDANRKSYEAARQDFEAFVSSLIKELGKMDPALEGLQAKQCIFRLNRDIRFSKDKAPYKTHFGAAFSRGGRKGSDAGYYIHLEPGASFAGGGMWMPDAEQLRKIRQEIDYNFADFNRIIHAKRFKDTFSEIDGEQLVRPPKGYDEANPAIEYLKLKSFTVGVPLTDKDIEAANLVKSAIAIFKTMQPFIDFMNTATAD